MLVPRHTVTNFYTKNKKRILLSNAGELFTIGNKNIQKKILKNKLYL